MFKVKYLHRKLKSNHDNWYGNEYKKEKNLNIFVDLPKRQSMYKQHWSEIDWTISKVKKKFRYSLENILPYVAIKPIYDDDFIPRDKYGRILEQRIFIDYNNLICKKTKDEILDEAHQFKRKIDRKNKLKRIFENQINEE